MRAVEERERTFGGPMFFHLDHDVWMVSGVYTYVKTY